MDLTSEAMSFMTLVNVLSFQDNNFTRVIPMDPDNSLLVHKLEDNTTVGGVMPPTGMIPAAEITAIRDWITNGALQ